MNMLKTLLNKIGKSLYDRFGNISHTKISSYVILIGIYISSLVYLGIDIVNAIMVWSKGEVYEIPMTHIGILVALLGHHLALLGIKKNSENKQTLANNETLKNTKDLKDTKEDK